MNIYGIASSDEILEWIQSRGVTPLYLAVSGSHMWGLNRPDSDLDVRGIYLAPTEQILSLDPGRDTIEALNVLGKDVDIQLYELGKALGMLRKHNGNLVELLFAPTCFYNSNTVPWHELATKFVTKKLSHYYKGYFHSQRKRSATNRGGKALLHTYREIMAGIVLMRTGYIVYDFTTLKRTFEEMYKWRSHLLDSFMNRSEWRNPVSEERLNAFMVEWEKLEELLASEVEKSELPDGYDGYKVLNSILLRHRLSGAKSARSTK